MKACIPTPLKDSSFQYLNEWPIFTSYNYPWAFDDPNEHRGCYEYGFEDYGVFIPLVNRDVLIFDFESFEGISMNLVAYTDKGFHLDMCKNVGKVKYNISFVQPPDHEIEVQADCVKIKWCSTVPAGDNFGFMMSFHRRTVRPDEVICEDKYELVETDPHLVLHAAIFSSHEAVCVSQKCSPPDNCAIIMTVTIVCEPGLTAACLLEHQLLINGYYLTWPNYTQRISPSNGRVLFSQQIVLDSFLYFEVATEDSVLDHAAISLQAQRWIRDDVDYALLTSSYRNQPYGFRFEAQERPLWVTLPVAMVLDNDFAFTHQNLKKFRWDHHPNGKCNYQFRSGPAPGKVEHPERILMTLSDKDRFIELPLESFLYSILIPPGCSPSLYLGYFETKSSDYQRYQEVCDGMVMITSRGYQNPFEPSSDPRLPYLWRQITCTSFAVNTTIEVLSVGSGNLTIQFLNNETRAEQRSLPFADRFQPYNVSQSSVVGVVISWKNGFRGVEMNGCFVKVHITRAFLITH